MQDYIDLAGLKIWQEELSRVVYYNIEQVGISLGVRTGLGLVD